MALPARLGFKVRKLSPTVTAGNEPNLGGGIWEHGLVEIFLLAVALGVVVLQ
jgi:hypothetical protein